MTTDDKTMNVFCELQFLSIDIRTCLYYSLTKEVSVTRSLVRCVGYRRAVSLKMLYCTYWKEFCSPLRLQESFNIA